jgi:hypothetical protein
MQSITLIIPGLFGPDDLDPAALPRLPALERLLAAARRVPEPARGYAELIFSQFGFDTPAGRDLPAAPVTRLCDARVNPGEIWMRADPVHLAAGPRGITLVDPEVLALSHAQAEALATSVRPYFAERGWALEPTAPTRWYLRLNRLPEASFTDLYAAAGRDIHDCMPRGAERQEWNRRLNEIQMLLCASEVNREREARGQPPVNSLWFWGAGCLPAPWKVDIAAVAADDPLVLGLAELCGIDRRVQLPTRASELLEAPAANARSLWVACAGLRLVAYGEAAGWREHVERLEREWFEPLLAGLRRARVPGIELLLPGAKFVIRRSNLLYFWRRRRPINAYLVKRDV